MRWLARLSLGMVGLSLVVPATASAQVVRPQTSAGAVAPASAAAPHKHKGILAWRHCVECQRARAKAQDGVDVPPPPSMMMAPGTVVPAAEVHPADGCAACQAGTVVSGPVTFNPSAPGHAVVGGPGMMVADGSAGYAVVGEEVPLAEPAPVGLAKARLGQPMPGAMVSRGMPGSVDSSVVPTSIPPAPTPMANPDHNRPHVIGHLFGVTGFGRERREARARREEESHASIAYEEKSEPVTELPASVVYGKKKGFFGR